MAKKRSHRGHGHLYKFGSKPGKERVFEERYGKKKGKEVYGKVVGKVWRARHPGKKSWNAGKHHTTK